MKYYDIQGNWRKIKKHLNNKKLIAILVRDMNRYTWGRWRKKFTNGDVPQKFDSTDWLCCREKRGRLPAYYDYSCHLACHWLVNFNLRLAQLLMPDEEWRIVTSVEHSTVWNGKDLLFDFNFLAFGIGPDQCFKDANDEILEPGIESRCHMPEYYKNELTTKSGRTIITSPARSATSVNLWSKAFEK